jgi:hypothetical protein
VVEKAGLTGSCARIDGVEATRRYKDGVLVMRSDDDL